MLFADNSRWGRACAAMGIIMALLLPELTGCEKPKQQKSYTVGIINPGKESQDITRGFTESLAKAGFIEGKKIAYLTAGEDPEAAVADMTSRRPDLLFTVTTPATRAALKASEKNGIPVVFSMYDPVESKIVKSLRDTGGNFTGIQVRGSTPKALEFLLKISPGLKNVFVPVSFDTKAAEQSLADLKAASEKLGVSLTVSEVSTVDELNTVLAKMPSGIDAVFIIHTILVMDNTELIVNAALKRRIPTASCGHELHKRGVVVCYGQSDYRIGVQAGRLAQQILLGASPSSLPVENADYLLGLNAKTAKAVGMVIPDAVLRQAETIIQD